MNFASLTRILKPMLTFKKKQIFGVEILSELLDREIDRDELKRIMGLDLGDEIQLRKLLPKKHYARYCRLTHHTEQRKALSVILTSLKLEKTLKTVFTKAMLYPVFLFNFSLLMCLFVDGVLFKTFKSMLSFIGPNIEFQSMQSVIRILITLDFLMILSILLLWLLVKQNPLKLYHWIVHKWPNNPWSQLNSHQFVSKFQSFYKLGGNFEEIFRQIQLSSDPILSYGCACSLNALKSGEPLSFAVTQIDPRLQLYFKMSDEGLSIESHLNNHNRIQELLINDRIKQFGKVVLAYAYLQVTAIIVVIYQMMLKPIEMMGNYL